MSETIDVTDHTQDLIEEIIDRFESGDLSAEDVCEGCVAKLVHILAWVGTEAGRNHHSPPTIHLSDVYRYIREYLLEAAYDRRRGWELASEGMHTYYGHPIEHDDAEPDTATSVHPTDVH